MLDEHGFTTIPSSPPTTDFDQPAHYSAPGGIGGESGTQHPNKGPHQAARASLLATRSSDDTHFHHQSRDDAVIDSSHAPPPPPTNQSTNPANISLPQRYTSDATTTGNKPLPPLIKRYHPQYNSRAYVRFDTPPTLIINGEFAVQQRNVNRRSLLSGSSNEIAEEKHVTHVTTFDSPTRQAKMDTY